MIIEKVRVRIDAYIAQIKITNKVPTDDFIAVYRQAYVVYGEAKQLELEEKYKDAFKRYLDTFKLFRKVNLLSERINRLLDQIELDPLGDYDEDGLLNGYELEAFMGILDPTKKDTNGKGIIDSEEDYEDDGLTNLEEQNYGTNPLYDDTDIDGLTDYKEIHETKTNPNAEFFLAGHSLGGRLSQEVFYQIYDGNDGMLGMFKKNKKIPTHAATFNSLGYNIADYIFLKNSIVDNIKNEMNNYYYKYDLTGDGLGNSNLFKRTGKEVGYWISDININEEEFYKKTGYSLKTIHGIDLLIDDNKLIENNVIY